MLSKLCNCDVGQQTRCWDALVDHLRRYRSLGQRFTIVADPLSTDMALDGEYTRCVIKLLADIFNDVLERTATRAVGVVRLVIDQRARKLRR